MEGLRSDEGRLPRLASSAPIGQDLADGNAITSLDGLESLDSLVKVSLKGNSIAQVDFDTFAWSRVESLDLSGNGLRCVDRIGKLPALVSLNLGECHGFLSSMCGVRPSFFTPPTMHTKEV